MNNKDKFNIILNTVKNKVVKHSPEILLGVGIVSGIAAVGFAIRSTRDVDVVIDGLKNNLDDVKTAKETLEPEKYPIEAYRKDLVTSYATAGINLAGLYTPTIVCEAISIASLLTSFNVLSKRNAALTAAFAGVYSEYISYRERVAQRYGQEVEYELYNDISVEEIEVEKEGKDGKKKVVKEKVKKENLTEKVNSFFVGKDYCTEWEDCWDKDVNTDFIKIRLMQAEPVLNRRLASEGFIYMSDIMKTCGVKQTNASRNLAITYDPYYVAKLDENGMPIPQLHLDIYDSELTDGADKVLLVTIDGLKPFDIDSFDYNDLFKKRND